MMHTEIHYRLIHGLIDRGACPSNEQLAGEMGISAEEVEQRLRSLADIHGVVLHPHVCAPWVVHPFSLTPTPHWIEGSRNGWWAPCVWCALGVAALVKEPVRIHTRFGAEGEALVFSVSDGRPEVVEDIWVHFAIPPARAWDNVHQHCSMVLPFRSVGEIDDWCRRYGLPRGEAVPLQQVAQLAKIWYGSHADPNWRKWSIAEAQEIFGRVGLRSEFWDLGAKSGRF